MILMHVMSQMLNFKQTLMAILKHLQKIHSESQYLLILNQVRVNIFVFYLHRNLVLDKITPHTLPNMSLQLSSFCPQPPPSHSFESLSQTQTLQTRKGHLYPYFVPTFVLLITPVLELLPNCNLSRVVLYLSLKLQVFQTN